MVFHYKFPLLYLSRGKEDLRHGPEAAAPPCEAAADLFLGKMEQTSEQ